MNENRTIRKTLALITTGLLVGVALGRVRRYQTKYKENDVLKVESWLQINFLNKSYCFSRKVSEIN